MRRRATGCAALAGLLAALAGCGGGEHDPAIASATLTPVPADALVALHLSTDRRRGPVRVAAGTARHLPSWPRLQRSLLRRVSASGCGLDLRRRPGRELTFALLPAAGGASTPLLVSDAPAAGVDDVPGPCGALVVRRVGRLVVVGEPASVQAAADVAAGRRPGLTADAVFRRATAGLPAERALEAWASRRGTRELLAPLGGLWGALAGIVDVPGLRGAGAALVPRADGASLVVRRIARATTKVAAFEPTLQDVVPAGTLTYTAAGDLGSALGRFLVLAQPGAAGAPPATAARLQALGRLGGESATLVAPSAGGPATTLVSRVASPDRVRAALRALEPGLAQLVGAPAAASWADARPAGLVARTLSNAPGQALTWAVDGDTLIVSTTLEGVAAVHQSGPRLAGARSFRAVTGNTRNPITSLVFLDPNQLLRLGGDTGIGPAGALQGSRRDLAKVRAIGATTTGSSRESTVDLSLWIP